MPIFRADKLLQVIYFCFALKKRSGLQVVLVVSPLHYVNIVFYHNVESIGFDQNKIIILAFLKQFDYNRLLLIENSVVLVFSSR